MTCTSQPSPVARQASREGVAPVTGAGYRVPRPHVRPWRNGNPDNDMRRRGRARPEPVSAHMDADVDVRPSPGPGTPESGVQDAPPRSRPERQAVKPAMAGYGARGPDVLLQFGDPHETAPEPPEPLDLRVVHAEDRLFDPRDLAAGRIGGIRLSGGSGPMSEHRPGPADRSRRRGGGTPPRAPQLVNGSLEAAGARVSARCRPLHRLEAGCGTHGERAVGRGAPRRGTRPPADGALHPSDLRSGVADAVATGRAERDVPSDLRGALTPMRTKHYAAITDPKEVGPLLREHLERESLQGIT